MSETVGLPTGRHSAQPGEITMAHPTQKRNGFSLTELMVVLAVASILFAIAYPSMSRYQRTVRLSGAARVLEGDIHNAASIANAQRTTYQIVFQAGSYVVQQASPVNAIQTRQMPPGVTCAATDTARFFAWGLASPVTVTMTNSNGSTTLRILANGRVAYN
jgi:prepilin-type N-terminal cleavage/methylation domain-containing protein